MSKAALLELADRVEKASGWSRELDQEIYLAAFALAERQRMAIIPKFTKSLDAAMTLVPEGLDWRVDTMTGLPGAIVCIPNAWLSHKTAPMLVHGKSPALALTAASLRSRAQQESKDAT